MLQTLTGIHGNVDVDSMTTYNDAIGWRSRTPAEPFGFNENLPTYKRRLLTSENFFLGFPPWLPPISLPLAGSIPGVYKGVGRRRICEPAARSGREAISWQMSWNRMPARTCCRVAFHCVLSSAIRASFDLLCRKVASAAAICKRLTNLVGILQLSLSGRLSVKSWG